MGKFTWVPSSKKIVCLFNILALVFFALLGSLNNMSYGMLDVNTPGAKIHLGAMPSSSQSSPASTTSSTIQLPLPIPFTKDSGLIFPDIGSKQADLTPSASLDTCQKLSVRAISKSSGGTSASYAIDNNYSTFWNNIRLGSWIKLDLGSSYTICSVNIAWYKGNVRSYNFDISVSNDGSTFKKVFTGKSSGTTTSLEKYDLPSDTTARYIKITVYGNSRNNNASITEVNVQGTSGSSSPPPPPTSTVNYDDFENQGTYTLSDGQTSPNGKWKVAYTGFGSVGVQQDANTGNHYFFEQPKTSTSQGETHASMVLTTKQYSDFEMDLDMKTVAQLRQNSPPNTWETAWVFWHYTDEFHYYALTLKTNGLQIEKKDNTNHDDSAEIYLVDTSSQTVKLGQWQHIKIRHEGSTTPHIQVWVDGVKAADFIDNQPVSSSTLSSGYMGLYNEDAKANFDNVNINALTSQ
jgi:hypothetical protein